MSSDNKESLDNAMQTLNQLVSSHSTPKNFKKTISDLMQVDLMFALLYSMIRYLHCSFFFLNIIPQ